MDLGIWLVGHGCTSWEIGLIGDILRDAPWRVFQLVLCDEIRDMEGWDSGEFVNFGVMEFGHYGPDFGGEAGHGFGRI
jgi:hypothetical protein